MAVTLLEAGTCAKNHFWADYAIFVLLYDYCANNCWEKITTSKCTTLYSVCHFFSIQRKLGRQTTKTHATQRSFHRLQPAQLTVLSEKQEVPHHSKRAPKPVGKADGAKQLPDIAAVETPKSGRKIGRHASSYFRLLKSQTGKSHELSSKEKDYSYINPHNAPFGLPKYRKQVNRLTCSSLRSMVLVRQAWNRQSPRTVIKPVKHSIIPFN